MTMISRFRLSGTAGLLAALSMPAAAQEAAIYSGMDRVHPVWAENGMVSAQEQLAAQGIPVRVVSMPCTNVFDAQDKDWQDTVLPPQLPCVAIEAGVTDGWHKYVGRDGKVIGIDTYGESAPAGVLFEHFGLTAERVVATVSQILGE